MSLGPRCLILALCALSLALCGAVKNPPPEIPLAVNLRFTYSPTLLGLVAPSDPSGYGELFVRVVEAGEQRIKVRYEVKEEVAPGGAGDPSAAPATGSPTPSPVSPPEPSAMAQPTSGSKPITRIRRGVITATELTGAQTISHPSCWGDGDWETGTGLVWLSQATYQSLKSLGEAPWNASFTGFTDQAKLDQLNGYVDQLIQAQGSAPPVRLVVQNAKATYPCRVNGADVRLPAIYARDSLGLMEYWILDNPTNRLVLKAGFLAPSLHAAPASQPAASSLGEPASGSTTEPAPTAGPNADQATGVNDETQDANGGQRTESGAAPPTPTDPPEPVAFGMGYAITVLDF